MERGPSVSIKVRCVGAQRGQGKARQPYVRRRQVKLRIPKKLYIPTNLKKPTQLIANS